MGMCRKLADEVDPLSRVSFAMPEDALPPLKFIPQTTSPYGAALRDYDAATMASNFFAGQSEYDPFSGTPGGAASPGDNLLNMGANDTPLPEGQVHNCAALYVLSGLQTLASLSCRWMLFG